MSHLHRPLTLSAYAKINLTLDVLSKRDDGYHEIASVMQTISLADRVTVELTDGVDIELNVAGPFADGVPSDERNLAYRAAQGVLQVTEHVEFGTRIRLEKLIPSQAGLGGGSSDAATVMVALNRLLGMPLTIDALTTIAKSLGADVAFFLHGGTAQIGGIGERVTPLAPWSSPDFVIAKPHVGSDTRTAYEALDGLTGRASTNATASWPTGGLANDFEAVIYDLYPAIGEARAALLDSGADHVLLCGSGAAVAGFGGDPALMAERFRAAGLGDAWCVSPTGSE